MAYENRIRLPFHLRRPQFPTEEDIYLKANGTRIVQKSIVNKQYEGVTDYMPALLHERTNIAFRHDHVLVDGEKFYGMVRINGNYQIQWVDWLDYPVAPAQFQILEDGFAARNDRCDTCQDHSISFSDFTFPNELECNGEYDIDLKSLGTFHCDGVFFGVFDINEAFVTSFVIVGNNLHIKIRPDAPSSGGVVDIGHIVAQCPDDPDSKKTNAIKASINGCVESDYCEPPTDLRFSPNPDDPIQIAGQFAWTAPVSLPADGYHWELFKWNGSTWVSQSSGEFLADPMALPLVNVNGLDAALYKFVVYCICDRDAHVYSNEISMTVDYTAGGGGGGGTAYCYIDVWGYCEDDGFGNQRIKVKCQISSPVGITLGDNLAISGYLRNYSPYEVTAFTMDLFGGNTTGETDWLILGAEGCNPIVDSLTVTPSTSLGSDSVLYNIVLNIV